MKMSSADRTSRPWPPPAADAVFILENGARMDQPTFHRLYLKTPPKFRAELIAGVVHVSSPVSGGHGGPHAKLVGWLLNYVRGTPGIAVYNDTTMIMNDDTEPQPDATLLIEKRYGGQTWMDRKQYFHGAPEFAAEIAHSTASIDLGTKKAAYEKAGVCEYVVFSVIEQQVDWFIRRSGQLEPLAAAENGVLKSEIFPGLWLHPAAFFKPSMSRLFAVAQKGLDSPEHAAFVANLEARRKTQSPKPGKSPGKKPPRPRS